MEFGAKGKTQDDPRLLPSAPGKMVILSPTSGFCLFVLWEVRGSEESGFALVTSELPVRQSPGLIRQQEKVPVASKELRHQGVPG